MIRPFAIRDVEFDIIRHFIWQFDTENGNLQHHAFDQHDGDIAALAVLMPINKV